jgi:hypothetical protein
MNHAAYAATHQPGGEKKPAFSPGIRIGFWICIVIAVAAVIRRVVALVHPAQSGPPQMVALDAVFSSHAALTLAHILPALAFVLLTPFLYLQRSTGKPWVERLLFALGVIVGLTAYFLSRDSVGGWLERSAVLFFNTLFLFCLVRAWQFRTVDAVLKLRWMTRAIGVLLGIATTRPVMGVFFATSRLTHLSPSQFFGIAFWIGFSINTVIVELWLRALAGQAQLQRLAPRPA